MAHVTNRMFCHLEGKGCLRSGVEDFLLSAEYNKSDPLAAEFIRTFQHQFFFGKAFLDRYHAIREKDTVTVEKYIPKVKMYWDRDAPPDVVTLYGSRPSSNADLWFLSPWEFTQWWKPVQLKPPSRWYSLTQ